MFRLFVLCVLFIFSSSDGFAVDTDEIENARQSVFTQKVNVNSATVDELANALPGIGTKKAAAIIAYRESHGAFSSVDDLINVKGVGPKLMDRIRSNLEL